MKKLLILLSLLFTTVVSQAQDMDYGEFLDSALEAIENNEKGLYEAYLVHFSKALQEKNITPETLPEKYFDKYCKVIFKGAINDMVSKKNISSSTIDFLKRQYSLKTDDESALSIGYLYYKGITVSQSYDEAMRWFKISAQKGNEYAMNFLGIIYSQKKQYKEAEKWFLEAIQKGNRYAYENILNVYIENRDYMKMGMYSKKMEDKYGYSPIKEKAKKGDRNAIVFLSSAYIMGLGYKKDYDKALEYVKRIPEKDRLIKVLFRGRIYQEQGLYDKAIEDYKKFYEIRKHNAIIDFIALCYYQKGNNRKARKWANKADTPLTKSLLFYMKCENAMTISDFDYCQKYKNYYNQLSTYYPLEEIEQDLKIYFKTNYQEQLPKK